MELEYEHIDWSDIVDAELSGDHETLRKLRERAAEIKLRAEASVSEDEHIALSPISSSKCEPTSLHEGQSSNHHNPGSSNVARNVTNHVESMTEAEEDCLPAKPSVDEYPALGNGQNKENSLPFTTSSPLSLPASTTTSYAQMVNRNPKRTLVDRCLSPSEVPLKRSITSDIMKTPTEFKTACFFEASPSCETTPETDSLPGKAGIVQRRLFGTQQQTQEQAKSQPKEKLTDNHRLAQRQKQIDFGKNTLGYERYIQMVPKWKRQKTHPHTPDKYNSCSTRSWQGQMRVWRRQLHQYDPTPQENFTQDDARLCNVSLTTN